MLKKIKFSIFLVIALSVSFFSFSNTSIHDSIIDFNNNVVDFSETGLMDNVRNGSIVQISPLDLKVGSIFIDVDGIAKKVVSITQSGNDIIIDTVQPEIREVFEFYDIPIQTVNLTLDDHLLKDSAPIGYNLVPDNRASGTKSIEFEKKIGDDNASVSIAAKASLTVDVSTGARLPYINVDTKGTWKFWKWTIKKYQGFVQGDINYDLSLEGKLVAQAKFSKELNIPIFALTTGPGIDIGAGFYSNSSIEGSITLTDTLAFTLKGNAGARCGLDGLAIVCWPVDIKSYGSTEYSVKNTLSLEAKVQLKEKIYLGTWVKMFGFAILEADAGGGPYLDFNAMIEGWVQYSSKSKFSANWSYSGSGEIGVFAEINAKIFNGKWGGEIWGKKFPFYTISKSGGGKTSLVTFDSDGASTVADPESKTIDSSSSTIDDLPTPPKKTGFTFGGWFTEKNGAGTEFTASTTVTGSLTVYAKWIAAPQPSVNLALNKTTTASSIENASYAANYATDGNFNSRWASSNNFTNGQWIIVDLGSSTTFKTIKLTFEAGSTNYNVEWSNDSTKWTAIGSSLYTANSDSKTITLPTAVTGRYIRFIAQNTTGTFGVSLYEIEVYNN